MIKAAIFDLDGTLLDTVEALTYCTNLTMADLGRPGITGAQTKTIVGDGYRTQMERALKLTGGFDRGDWERAKVLYMQYFSRFCLKGVHPYKGILELLQALRERNIAIACFSNKPDAQAVENIRTFFPEGAFAIVRGERDGVPKKPDPAGALAIAAELQVSPGQCLYLGDTNTDMQTGKAAGMVTCGVLWGFREREELSAYDPALLVEKPAEVLSYLDSYF